MKTIRQVKTVFIIFIAFVSCWIPYVVVLLYDTTDSLPLPVHLYTSMLAHLHAKPHAVLLSSGRGLGPGSWKHYLDLALAKMSCTARFVTPSFDCSRSSLARFTINPYKCDNC